MSSNTYITRFLFALLISLCSISSVRAETETRLNLESFIKYFQDEGSHYDIKTIKDVPDDEYIDPEGYRFAVPDKDNSTYWIKIDLTKEKLELGSSPILYLPYREFTGLKYYKPLPDGTFQEFKIGRKYGLVEKDIDSLHIAFSTDLKGLQTNPIYLHVDYSRGLLSGSFPLYLYSERGFISKAQMIAISAAILWGVFFTLFLYNLATYLATGKDLLIFYLIYLVSAWCVAMGNDGFWGGYLLPISGTFPTRLLDFLTSVGCVFGYNAFLASVFNVKEKMPRVNIMLYGLYILAFVSGIVHLANDEITDITILKKTTIAGLGFTCSMAMLITARIRRYEYATMLMLFLVPLVVTGMIHGAYVSGQIPHTPIMPYLISLGHGMEILVLSFLIGDQLKKIIRDEELAKKAADVSRAYAEGQEAKHREKSQFIAHVGHDIRQPLHSLRLYLASLKVSTKDEEDLQTMDDMRTNINTLESMFNDVLFMSQLETERLEVEFQPELIGELIHSSANSFMHEAEVKGLSIRTHFNKKDTIVTDKNLLNRVLINLIKNAIRYSEKGGVLVSHRKRHDHHLIQVFDTGIGFDMRTLDDPNRRSRDTEGFGLGLTIVQGLVEKIGGVIEFDSVRGKGTRASIKLPLD